MFVPSESLATPGTEEGVWAAVGRGDQAASAEMFDRHGAAAYAVAHAVTGDPEGAEHAVVAAFVQLRTDAAGRGAPRPLRVEILDASRRCAGRAGNAGPPASRPLWRRLPEVYHSMPPDVRDALALATAGRCGRTEIAAIMGVDGADVRRNLRDGLRHAAATLERWDGSATRGENTGER